MDDSTDLALLDGLGEMHGSEVLGVPRVGRRLGVAAIRCALVARSSAASHIPTAA